MFRKRNLKRTTMKRSWRGEEDSSLFKTMAVYEPCSCVRLTLTREENKQKKGGGTFLPQKCSFPTNSAHRGNYNWHRANVMRCLMTGCYQLLYIFKQPFPNYSISAIYCVTVFILTLYLFL